MPGRLRLDVGGGFVKRASTEFSDVTDTSILGMFSDQQRAYDKKKSEAQQTMDNVRMRHLFTCFHRMLGKCDELSDIEERG